MSLDQTEYELFVSYARKDNRPIPETFPHGWVVALKDFILADHRQYSPAPLRVFFDTDEIRDMDDWRNRILGALRRSKVMLICLSPNYFASQPCRWEWEEYQARQHHKLMGSDSHATVYFVEVPGTNEQENARRLDALMEKNFTDLRPWFPAGAAAMQEEAVRQRLAVLGQSLWERIDRARRALTVPGNVRGMTPYFVGRNRELADLHRLVGVGKIGLVTAVHGLGGQGKTELAVAYARSYADSYNVGLWWLPAEGKKDLLPLLGELAWVPEFGYTPSEAERNDGEKLGRAVLLELHRRAEAARERDPAKAPAALILLDNVSEPTLLASTQLSRLRKADWLRVIATTRLDPRPLDPVGKALGQVLVDSLDPDTALWLIREHLPGESFRTPRDEADAREIVRELGGFTLAVEQVAVFLGVNPEVTPGDYLARLRAEGLPSTDALVNADTAGQIEHQQKQLRPILESMLAQLPAAGRTLLGFASFLPPDLVPWPWLRELTCQRHPEIAETKPGYPDPWVTLRRQVEGLRFLTGSIESEFARMHRLIGAHLRDEIDETLDSELRAFVARRSDQIYQEPYAPAEWELSAILVAVPHLLQARADRGLAIDAMFLSDKVLAYRDIPAAFALLRTTRSTIEQLAQADPTNAQMQRDLSISFERLGDVSVAAGTWPPPAGTSPTDSGFATTGPGRPDQRPDAAGPVDLVRPLGGVSVAAGTWPPPAGTSPTDSGFVNNWPRPTRPTPRCSGTCRSRSTSWGT
ncbi:tetratricopeptide repeat protein [Fimbriiglobus ruber]|uniref:Putative ATP/GTP binding protein n=1 Tax=Fimbriiglobus ruber TaxID=1908690 RepID=A0A225E161_9BACT|nr:toll/interleukin-1 receptor domain-containing protein [Fimbriiglobus ruber]OWK43756.1 putative ATP/GTP binding protein [Fimbriiglobus ruber]